MIMSISYTINKGKKFYYYICRNKSRSKKICNMKNIKMETIDNLVLDKLLNLEAKDNILNKLIECNKNNTSINTIDNEIKLNERKINKNKNDIDKLTIKLIEIEKKNVIEIIENKIDKLDLENNNLSNKIIELKSKKINSKTKSINIDLIKENLEFLSEHKEDLTIEEKRKIVRSIVKTVYWNGKNFEIILNDL